MSGKNGGGGGAVVGFLFLAGAYMIASIVLQALILSRGLRGQFVPEGTIIAAPGAATVGGATTQVNVQPTRPGYAPTDAFQPIPMPETSPPAVTTTTTTTTTEDPVHDHDHDHDHDSGGLTNPAASGDGDDAMPGPVLNPANLPASALSVQVGGAPPRTIEDNCQVRTDFQGENEFVTLGCEFIIGSDPIATNQQRWDAGCFPVGVPPWHPENNILIQFPDPEDCNVAVSDTWMVSGWNHTMIQLAPNQVFIPPMTTANEMIAVKLLRGTLLDINTNGILRSDGHWETYVVTPPNRAVSLWLSSSVTRIPAGDEGAAFIFFKVPRNVFNMPVTDMAASPTIDNSGPFSENLEWVQFGNYYNDFAQVEFYNYAGMLLNNHDGTRLTYLQWWTFREDEDADGYHNHEGLGPDNTFAELHMALFPSSGTSGMQTTLPNTNNLLTQDNPNRIRAADEHKYNNNDQTEVQLSIPLPPGYVHGPLWSVNANTGEPSVGCNGGVLYPFHRWLGGAGDGPNGYHNPPRYSLWIAFEHPPQYATIPRTMLSSWTNAYLQSEMDTPDCAP